MKTLTDNPNGRGAPRTPPAGAPDAPRRRTAKNTRATKTAGAPALAPPRRTALSLPHDDIAKRAFEIFVARGRGHGRAEEDWLLAEAELRAASNLRTGAR